MSYYALVKDGVVINTIVWDGSGDYDFGEGVAAHEAEDDSGVSIGWLYVDGKFSAPPEPDLTHEQLVSQAAAEKYSRLNSADEIFIEWQTKLLLNMATEDEKNYVIAWVKYKDAVRAVDVQKAPDITWPERPPSPDNGK